MNVNYLPVDPRTTSTRLPVWTMEVSSGTLRLYFSLRKQYELYLHSPDDGYSHPVATFSVTGMLESWRKASKPPRLTCDETQAVLREVAEVIQISSVHLL